MIDDFELRFFLAPQNHIPITKNNKKKIKIYTVCIYIKGFELVVLSVGLLHQVDLVDLSKTQVKRSHLSEC